MNLLLIHSGGEADHPHSWILVDTDGNPRDLGELIEFEPLSSRISIKDLREYFGDAYFAEGERVRCILPTFPFADLDYYLQLHLGRRVWLEIFPDGTVEGLPTFRRT